MPKKEVIARRWARIAATDDGKKVIEDLKKQFAWDEAGNGAATEDGVFLWIGNRAVIKHILQSISMGNNLSENNNTDE